MLLHSVKHLVLSVCTLANSPVILLLQVPIYSKLGGWVFLLGYMQDYGITYIPGYPLCNVLTKINKKIVRYTWPLLL